MPIGLIAGDRPAANLQIKMSAASAALYPETWQTKALLSFILSVLGSNLAGNTGYMTDIRGFAQTLQQMQYTTAY
jgi:hypothetical protein